MKSIIQKLYNLCMEEKWQDRHWEAENTGDDLCKKKREDAYQSYQKLRSRLTGELAEELDILMDKHLEIFPQELENSFEAGFKTGAKLMCEIFSEEAETIKRYGSFRDQWQERQKLIDLQTDARGEIRGHLSEE